MLSAVTLRLKACSNKLQCVAVCCSVLRLTVADVVSNHAGVEGRVLVELLSTNTNHFARKICANIGSLGENTTSNAAEHGNRGASQTVAGKAFEKCLIVYRAHRAIVLYVRERETGREGGREGKGERKRIGERKRERE